MECEKKVETPLTKKQKIIYSVFSFIPFVLFTFEIISLVYQRIVYGKYFTPIFLFFLVVLAVGCVYLLKKLLNSRELLGLLTFYGYLAISSSFIGYIGLNGMTNGKFCSAAEVLHFSEESRHRYSSVLDCAILRLVGDWSTCLHFIGGVFIWYCVYLVFFEKQDYVCPKMGCGRWIAVLSVLFILSVTPLVTLLFGESRFEILLEKGL